MTNEEYDYEEGDGLECMACGWQGDYSELQCSQEDADSDKPIAEIVFNLCPLCNSSDIENVE